MPLKSLRHNGVLVPPPYQPKGLSVKIKGKWHKLTPQQEERVVAWAKKMGTPYVEDPVFAENFHRDLSELLGFQVKPGDIDYQPIYQMVLEERERKKNLPPEERKRLREERKRVREANKEKYGWVEIDGVRCEIANYTVEPSSIFMGRGAHPLRGRWKEGPRHEDIELNLSPDAPVPPGSWKAVVWEPDHLWIARWRDKLTGKMKYVWPHDSAPLKQSRDKEKYDKAVELRRNLDRVREFIESNLDHPDLKRRKTATVCYLIDQLNFRVGDEKDEADETEADTVGASSLRPQHISFNPDGSVTFDFLGKDSVRHLITAHLDERAVRNLKEFAQTANNKSLFEEVDSTVVSEFLDEVMEGLSAKVFRTCHATEAVEKKLEEVKVDPQDPEYVKKHAATLANLEAAKACNHKRTIPKTWEESLRRQKERLKERRRRALENQRKYREKIAKTRATYDERLEKLKASIEAEKEALAELERQLEERLAQGKPSKGLKRRVESKKRKLRGLRKRLAETKRKRGERLAKLREAMERRKTRDREAIEKAKLQIRAKELTRDYNLGTSLKNYIDPRVYLDWGRRVDYDWRNYYSKALVKKFSWIDNDAA